MNFRKPPPEFKSLHVGCQFVLLFSGEKFGLKSQFYEDLHEQSGVFFEGILFHFWVVVLSWLQEKLNGHPRQFVTWAFQRSASQ